MDQTALRVQLCKGELQRIAASSAAAALAAAAATAAARAVTAAALGRRGGREIQPRRAERAA